MLPSRTSFLRKLLVPALAVNLAVTAQASTMSIDVLFADLGGGIFRYEFIITNTGMEDIAFLTINDAPMNDILIGPSLSAPEGFIASYDPIGFVDFAGDTASFTPGDTFTGISFESSSSPDVAFTDFTAFTNGGELVTITTNLVPEPSSSLLLLCGIASFCFSRRR